MRATALFSLATSLCFTLPLAADTPADGFQLDARPYPKGVLALTLSDGDIITFDQKTVARWDADGTFLLTLAGFETCDPFVFPVGDCLYTGAFGIAPSETYALVGESSFGDLFRVDLLGGGKTLVGNIPYNYDLAFESETSVIVSAANASFASTDLVRLDTFTGASFPVAELSSFSGPVAVDAAGDVYYGSQATSDVLHFTAAQAASGGLTDLDATIFSTGFDLASQLVAGSDPGVVYMAESDFFTGVNAVWELGPDKASSTPIATSPDFFALGNLQFRKGIRGAAFRPFQPAFGGVLGYTARDFISTFERFEVRPARPQAVFTGPGVDGVGVLEFELTGGPVFGLVLILFGPQPLYNPVEAVLLNPGMPPLFTGLDLLTAKLLPLLFFTDSAGAMDFAFSNDGTLTDILAMQAILLDGSTGSTLGMSTTALN